MYIKDMEWLQLYAWGNSGIEDIVVGIPITAKQFQVKKKKKVKILSLHKCTLDLLGSLPTQSCTSVL